MDGEESATGQAANGLVELTEVLTGYANTLIASLPSLVLAAGVFLLFYILANVARRVAAQLSERITEDASLRNLFGTLARVAVLVIGVFCAASVLFPGLSAGDLVGVLGLSSVAVGFAFKDIFQNFLAGVLILAQRPFQIDDQIVVAGYEGAVEDISVRSTLLRTYNGERVIIPNATIYNSEVQVRTAHENRRTSFSTGIGYGEDIEEGREVIRQATLECEGVLDDPAPQIFVSGHGDSSVNFDVRFWTKSRQADATRTKNEVATKVKYALDEAGIEIPYPYRTVEFFDKTEKG
jgi:small-conductance mechanosensitive channel